MTDPLVTNLRQQRMAADDRADHHQAEADRQRRHAIELDHRLADLHCDIYRTDRELVIHLGRVHLRGSVSPDLVGHRGRLDKIHAQVREQK